MREYPYYSEPSHDRGSVASAQRDTSVSSAEGRLRVDMVDRIFLLESTVTPMTALLTNVGKRVGPDGKTWQGQSLQKAPVDNPEFKWLIFPLILGIY